MVPKIWAPYSLALVGLEAVHVVGASDAPGTQELQQVDLHWGLHKHKIILGHSEAGTMEKKGWLKSLMKDQIHSKTHMDTPVHVGRLKPLSTGELHHHLGLLNGIRFI